MEENSKKTLGIVALVLAILSLCPLVIGFETIKATMILECVALLFGVCAAVLGFVSKKDAKGMAIAAIVIGIISMVFVGLSLLGLTAISKATDCVDNGDGTATCQYMGQELEIPTDYLTEDQMKKEESVIATEEESEPEVTESTELDETVPETPEAVTE